MVVHRSSFLGASGTTPPVRRVSFSSGALTSLFAANMNADNATGVPPFFNITLIMQNMTLFKYFLGISLFFIDLSVPGAPS